MLYEVSKIVEDGPGKVTVPSAEMRDVRETRSSVRVVVDWPDIGTVTIVPETIVL